MHRILIVSSIACALALTCFGQKESLLIGPGDMVHVQVYDTPEMEQKVRVTDAGDVTLPFVGTLHVAGELPRGAAESIEAALVGKGVMLHPQVTVTVDQYATQNVSIMGQVAKPGSYPLATPLPVLDVLSLAGGLNEAADRHIVIQRHGDPSQKVAYYLANDGNKALDDSVLVSPGDTIVVSKAPFVYILGDVARPGAYPMATNDSKLSLLQAIAMAGSPNKTALMGKVRLIRDTPDGKQDLSVRLNALEAGKEPDVQLQANDVIFVPFSWMKNTALSAGSIAASTSGAAVYTR